MTPNKEPRMFEQIVTDGLWPCDIRMTRLNPPPEVEVALCAEWIEKFAAPTRALNRRNTSYGLKHKVQHWARTAADGAYASNGAFIEAARRAGYRVARAHHAGSPNACFNMSIRKWTQHVRASRTPGRGAP